MAMCENLSDLGFNIIKYGWIVLASLVFLTGMSMVIVAETQTHIPEGIGAGGFFTMIAGGLLIVIWICWICRCGCFEGTNCCQREPVYL
jgi:hypothetical protein